MRKYKILKTNVFEKNGFRIEPIRDEDKYAILQIRNEQLYHLRQTEPLTREKQEHYFATVVSNLFEVERPDQLLFSFFENNEFIGYGGLVHINWIDKNAEISFVMKTELEKEYFAKYWSVFLQLIEKVAFEQLKFHRIFTYAFDLRPHLYNVLESCNYQLEKVLKNVPFANNKSTNVKIHSKTFKRYCMQSKFKDYEMNTFNKKIAIITGANKGLGEALFNQLFNNEYFDKIVSLSRRVSKVQADLISNDDPRFEFIPVDLSMLNNSELLKNLETISLEAKEVLYINNAGTIFPIGKIGELNDNELVESLQVNVLAPSIIINYVLKTFCKAKIEIINITSGAANYSIDGWSVYGSSKAYLKFFTQSLSDQEANNNFVKAINVDPGVIDTDMQLQIRNSSIPGFTKHADFVALKEDGKLQPASMAAQKIIEKISLII
ncbi:SDR family NAD(P)-dependent oxidoreductase [Flavobacterium sp. N2270]|uniref:SDR family NAD(P)-dependent oxidoreductase n=1 Tax=Flavobacterium sp. N2270 TaxID=2986831 RepID=UPI002224E3D8|nr:SDR family NAD(P)-dependent oxidoreductase [Flavobacterium sp. N2270]